MNRPRPARRWGLSALAVAFALALLIPAPRNEADTPDGTVGSVPGESALRASIDPETGALVTGPAATRPGRDKALGEETRRMLSRSHEGLVQVVQPHGGVSVKLQGRFMSATVARLDDDGRPETLCTEDSDEAEAFLAGETTQPATDAYGREVR